MILTYTISTSIVKGDTAVTVSDVPVTGYLKGITVTAAAMEGTTYTAAITDKHGVTVFTRGSLAESATTTMWKDKYNELSTTIVEGALLNTPMVGPVDLIITADAHQEHAAVAFTVYIYYDN